MSSLDSDGYSSRLVLSHPRQRTALLPPPMGPSSILPAGGIVWNRSGVNIERNHILKCLAKSKEGMFVKCAVQSLWYKISKDESNVRNTKYCSQSLEDSG